MYKRLGLLTAVACGAALAVGAVPAITADDGTIVGTISVEAAAPCIQLTTTALDFGTAPFAANGGNSRGVSGGVGVTNCSAATSTFAMAGTDASGPGGTWFLTDEWLDCDGRLNRYGLFQYELPENFSGQYLVTAARTLLHRRPPTNDPVSTFNAGETENIGFILAMPCIGSDGAGQAFSFSIGLTATVS